MENFTNKPKTDTEILNELAQKYPEVALNLLQPEDDGRLCLSVQSKNQGAIAIKALDDIVTQIVKLKISNLQIITPEHLPDFKVLLQSKSLKTVYVANPPFNSFSVSEIKKCLNFLPKTALQLKIFIIPNLKLATPLTTKI